MQKKAIRIAAFVLLLASLSAFVAGVPPFLVSWSAIVFLLFCVNFAVWKSLMRLATFALFVIWSFAFLGNLIPQSRAGSSVAMGDIERTPEAFIDAGNALFYGKGKCSTCHIIGEGATEPRCPNLANIGISAANRKPGVSAKDYLIESLYLPSEYLVQGYGKIMPEIWKPPIALSTLEIEAVIAFLQSQGGEPDVSPITPPVDVTAFAEAPQRKLKGDADEGKIVFEELLECISCHKVGGKGGEGGVGPELTEIGALNSVAYIEESILEPNAQVVSGFGWTQVYLNDGEQLSGTIIKEDDETITLKLDETSMELDWDFEDEGEEEDEGNTTAVDQERIVNKTDIEIEEIEISEIENFKREGYFWLQATIGDSTNIEGNLTEEDENSFTIKTDDELVKIEKSTITELAGKKISVISKMPMYDELMTIRQFEDLLAYLASLKGA